MSRGVSTSQEASSVTVTMDTTKMTTFLTSALILMSAWKADQTVTSVLICREGEKLNNIYIRWRTPYTTIAAFRGRQLRIRNFKHQVQL